MKKRLLATAVVLGALVVTPKYISGQVESTLDKIVTTLNENPAYQAKVKSSEMGWFSSSAIVEVSLDFAALMQSAEGEMPEFDDPIVFDIDFAASHGLITTKSGLGLNLLDWTAQYHGAALRAHLEWDESLPFYAINGQTNLLGNGLFNDASPAFTAKKNEDGMVVNASAYAGSGTYNAKGYTYLGTADTFTLEDDDMLLKFDTLTLDIDAKGNLEQSLSGDMFDSKMSALLKQFSFQHKQFEQSFDMSDMLIAMDTKLKQDGKLIDAVVDYKIAKIESPDFVAQDLVLSAAMNNISADVMKAYQTLSQELIGLQPAETESKMLAFVQTHLLDALTPQPELNITDFKGVIPQGKFALRADSKIANVEAMPANLLDPGFWLGHIVANAELEADKAVIEMLAAQQLTTQLMANPEVAVMSEEEIAQIVAQQTPVMLENLSQQGLLIQTEEGYRSKFVMADSQAKINDTPIPLPGV